MTEYLHYWRRERFQLAFVGLEGLVRSISSAWYPYLQRGDIVWLLTRGIADAPAITARVEVASAPKRTSAPPYAYGNSRDRGSYEVSAAKGEGVRTVQLTWKELGKLRFDAASDRVHNRGLAVYECELAALRRLTASGSALLETWWQTRREGANESAISAAFGDTDTNTRIERAAIHFVRKWYEKRGWVVVSRERERIGYDLLCTRGAKIAYVEVKGRSSDSQQIILTRGEYNESRRLPGYRLCIVTRALQAPRPHWYEGTRIDSLFVLQPLAYLLSLKTRRD